MGTIVDTSKIKIYLSRIGRTMVNPSKRKSSNTTSDEGSSSKHQKTDNGEVGKYVYNGSILFSDEEVRTRDKFVEPIPKKDKNGTIIFPDAKDFRPNMTPKEVLQEGSFGGTYFRPIKSGVTGLKYNKMWNELPQNWLEGLDVKKQVSSVNYDNNVNKYKVKCGGSLEMWESSGWIKEIDPYGWFMWYCRFYLGRRDADDARQIQRWSNCTGPKGRWKNNLIGKIVKADAKYTDANVSPVIRQVLQHWAYTLTEKDYEARKKQIK